jgi:hypothetical protein
MRPKGHYTYLGGSAYTTLKYYGTQATQNRANLSATVTLVVAKRQAPTCVERA